MSDKHTVFRAGDRVVRRGSGALATVRAFRESSLASTNRLQVTWDDGGDDPVWHYSVVFDHITARRADGPPPALA